MTVERVPVRRVITGTLIADALLWCLMGALLVAGFVNAAAVGRAPTISLRFKSDISGKAAYAARQYSVEHISEDAFWPTFWREDTATLVSELATVTADCVVISGDANVVWPAEYIAGAPPGVTDGAGCAVSSALAWRLWGGMDVAGMTVEVDGETRTVRGVFESERELALLSCRDEDTDQSFTAAELTGGPRDAVRSDAESFATQSGLGRPDTILMNGGAAFLAGLLSVLPLAILALYGLALVIGLLRRRYTIMRKLTPYVALLCAALALPGLLGLLPAWMIPSLWSDFSFWSSLISDLKDGAREFLSAAPGMRDIELRMQLLGQIGIAFISVCCTLSVCFRWQMRRNIDASRRQNG